MEKKIIIIDEEKCIGCGLCASTCKESAIGIVNGKAKLMHEDYCDGIGNCLPVCPTHAISFKNNTRPLNQWPVQIKLVSPAAPYFKDANLLISADCCAYAYSDFNKKYMEGKITIIGCPKLDNEDYAEKLTAILKHNDIKSVTVARMEVPCCSGLESAVRVALQNCGDTIPCQVVTVFIDGAQPSLS